MMRVSDSLLSRFTEPRRDALWGHIYLTPELEAITQSTPFMKLHRICQLGPAYLCYPGATHTRAAHSFGVYYLARRILLRLLEEGSGSYVSREGLVSMLCAALLHDIGHFPYAHSLKELPLLDHEKLSAQIIRAEPLKSLIGKTGGDPYFAAAIIDLGLEGGGNPELAFYRKILSGALDPDKLDYLNRDARYCGLPYGAQDVDYVISMLHPHQQRGVEIDARGIPSVESVLFSKYLMYRSVYWHHRVRAATSMVKKAVYEGLNDGVLAAEELYGLDDDGLFALLASRAHPAFELAARVKAGQLFSLENEFRYNEDEHGQLLDLRRRAGREAEIAGELSRVYKRHIPARHVVIDVPEPVVFDADLWVQDEACG
ncbi:MAG: HD domain-containing protein, partial [Spirochaetaceae bacterium]|nr:HD domain-containing protein [Spirochaetaceae bacterium]